MIDAIRTRTMNGSGNGIESATAAQGGRWQRLCTAVWLVLLILLVTGCGGGGSSQPPATYTLSGSIQPDALNRVDSDTNDPETLAIRNNHPDQAQRVLTPAIIGGFVAAPGTASRFGDAGDEWDVYEVELLEGQQIVLEFPDPVVADLDLYLLDGDGRLLDSSLSEEHAVESLIVPQNGLYFVAVHAFEGRSNYGLRIEAVGSGALQTRRAPRVSDAFVPGEAIGRTHPASPERNAARLGQSKSGDPGVDSAMVLEAMGVEVLAGGLHREQLWRLPEVGRLGIADHRTALARPWLEPHLRERYQTLIALKVLAKRPEVDAVSPNFHVSPQQLPPDDPLLGFQWYHANIDLPEAWAISTGLPPDQEVVIAVVDTGVFLDHEDLAAQLLSGHDFITNSPTGDDPGDNPEPGRSSWHGSHVAGTAAATTNNETGVAGVSWGARILPVRTLGEGGGTLYDTLQGIRYAAGLPNDYDLTPVRRADVINLSLGGGTFSTIQADLYQQIRELGIFVIAAAGNSGERNIIFPAGYDAVFAVGATDAINRRAPYSNYGDALDWVAPGGDMRFDRTGDGFPDGILSTVADDLSGTRRSSYSFYQGTSMATAVSSGVVALARANDPTLTPDALAGFLEAGLLTDDLGPAGWDEQTGWGQINALKVLTVVRDGNGTPDAPRLSVSPQRLDFGFTESELEIALRNSGGGTLRVTAIDAPAPWLSVAANDDVDANGLGTYRVMVERQGLTFGDHVDSIRVRTDTGGDRDIPVTLRVAESDLTIDTVGRIYVTLIDANRTIVAQQGLNPEAGIYQYRFDGIPEGEYRILAGSDMNDDRRICDPGEACGAYPTLFLFERIQVDRDRADLNFSVGFRSQPGLAIATERFVPEPRSVAPGPELR